METISKKRGKLGRQKSTWWRTVEAELRDEPYMGRSWKVVKDQETR